MPEAHDLLPFAVAARRSRRFLRPQHRPSGGICALLGLGAALTGSSRGT